MTDNDNNPHRFDATGLLEGLSRDEARLLASLLVEVLIAFREAVGKPLVEPNQNKDNKAVIE